MRFLVPQNWSRRGQSPVFMGDLFEDFDQMFDQVLSNSTPVHFQPGYEVTEGKNHYLISFDMPGVKKDDVKIEVQGNQLMVSAERRESKDEEKGNTLRRERTYGHFERSFVLPASINADKIEAHYEDGVLNVALPKAEATKGRHIEIQTGEKGFLDKLFGKDESSKKVKDVKVS